MSKPSILQVIQSVFAAVIGVQSDKNRERDFKGGSVGIYLIVGLIATVTFIMAITLIVTLVI
jgi:hypothetical protein